MKKIPSIFIRDHTTGQMTSERNPEAQWVFNGEGIATRKWDGTACMVRNGRIYKRYDCKKGKVPPPIWEPCQDPDPITGHWPGWVPVKQEGANDQPYRDAFQGEHDGTYELCGPKINANPEGFIEHVLVPHGNVKYPDFPRTYTDISVRLVEMQIEGVVWHHPDGRMAKIKLRDFGFKRHAL
jgi:Family of unknown function (DUF5565)